MLVLKQYTHQAKQTNHARYLSIHKNKPDGQPNDHWGLDIIQQIKHNHIKVKQHN